MNPIIPNRIYRHFKGDHYLLIDVAKHSETGEDYVVYRFQLLDVKSVRG